MIQFNLLPDVKLEYIRARRTQRLVFGVSAIVTAISIGILLVVLSIGLAQNKHLKDVNKDIASESSQLQHKPQIDRILTVQNQLESLGKLHDAKPAASRLFEYLNEVTPVEDSVTDFGINFVDHTATINGTADALSSVNRYIDTLKFTTYKIDGTESTKHAFSDVVLSTFAVGEKTQPGAESAASKATFNLTLTYDPLIFDTTQKISLTVPAQVTTRSQIDKPTDLFAAPPAANTAGGGR